MVKPLLASLCLLFLLAGGCGKKMSEEQLWAAAQQFEVKEDIDGALKTYEELSARFPGSPHADSVLQKLGMIYLNKKAQFDKAVATYERLVEKFPESKYQAQSMFMIGYIYANHVKNFEKAKTAYEQFMAKYPEHELTPSVQWELEHLGKDISEIDIFDGPAEAAGKANEATGSRTKP